MSSNGPRLSDGPDMQLGFWVAVVAVVAWSVLKLDWRHLVSSSPTATYVVRFRKIWWYIWL